MRFDVIYCVVFSCRWLEYHGTVRVLSSP